MIIGMKLSAFGTATFKNADKINLKCTNACVLMLMQILMHKKGDVKDLKS